MERGAWWATVRGIVKEWDTTVTKKTTNGVNCMFLCEIKETFVFPLFTCDRYILAHILMPLI